MSLIVQGTMTETLAPAQRQRFSWKLLKIESWAEVFEPRVLIPAAATLLFLFPFGAIFTVVPDQSRVLGLTGESKGLFYICYTRRLAGGAPAGRPHLRQVRPGAGAAWPPRALWFASLLLLAFAQSAPVFLAGAVLFGLGTGLNSPTIYAWTVDLSHPDRRGRAVSTMYMALEAGIGVGALLAGWMFSQRARPPALRAPGQRRQRAIAAWCSCWLMRHRTPAPLED